MIPVIDVQPVFFSSAFLLSKRIKRHCGRFEVDFFTQPVDKNHEPHYIGFWQIKTVDEQQFVNNGESEDAQSAHDKTCFRKHTLKSHDTFSFRNKTFDLLRMTTYKVRYRHARQM